MRATKSTNINLTDQFDIDPNTMYYCSPICKSNGFTYAMRLVLSTRKYPEALDQLRQLMPESLADINNLKWTLLHIACRNSNTFSTVETVKLLIDNGININATTKNNNTALVFAVNYSCADSNIETVKLLLDASADVTYIYDNGKNILAHACNNFDTCDFETLKLLIERNADINNLSVNNSTILMLLCSKLNSTRYIDAVKLLIDHGININHVNYAGNTALSYVCENITKPGAIAVLDMLIDAGADIDVVLAKKSYSVLEYVKYLRNKK